MTITTKAALASELRISKARISQYVKAGMPVRADGKLDREKALNWIKGSPLTQTYHDKGSRRARGLAERSERRGASEPLASGEPFDPKWPPAFKTSCDKCGDDFISGCVVMAVMRMAYRAPALAAVMAVKNGAVPATAYGMTQDLTLALMMAAEDALKNMGVRPFTDGAELDWLIGAFDEPNWPFLAEKAGVPCDVEGWHAAMVDANKAESVRG